MPLASKLVLAILLFFFFTLTFALKLNLRDLELELCNRKCQRPRHDVHITGTLRHKIPNFFL